jgi:hypothetical protein
LEDMLDNHELRLGTGDGGPGFCVVAFNVNVFSDDALLEKPGLCATIGLGGVAVGNGSGGT